MTHVLSEVRLELAQRSGGLDPDVEYVVLQALKEASPIPLGSWRICAALQATGIEMSEATAGRVLRQLDVEGLTRSVDNKGRILTEHGNLRLRDLEAHHERRSRQEAFLRIIRPEKIEGLLDVLHARRTVETETARLAALYATEEEIEQLQRAIRSHAEYMQGTGGEPDQNVVVHRLVAQASKNRVLLALVDLLFQDRELIQAHYGIQESMKGRYPEEHDEFLRAIRERQPDAAAEAMHAHISHLVQVVQEYISNKTAGDGMAEPGNSQL